MEVIKDEQTAAPVAEAAKTEETPVVKTEETPVVKKEEVPEKRYQGYFIEENLLKGLIRYLSKQSYEIAAQPIQILSQLPRVDGGAEIKVANKN